MCYYSIASLALLFLQLYWPDNGRRRSSVRSTCSSSHALAHSLLECVFCVPCTGQIIHSSMALLSHLFLVHCCSRVQLCSCCLFLNLSFVHSDKQRLRDEKAAALLSLKLMLFLLSVSSFSYFYFVHCRVCTASRIVELVSSTAATSSSNSICLIR